MVAHLHADAVVSGSEGGELEAEDGGGGEAGGDAEQQEQPRLPRPTLSYLSKGEVVVRPNRLFHLAAGGGALGRGKQSLSSLQDCELQFHCCDQDRSVLHTNFPLHYTTPLYVQCWSLQADQQTSPVLCIS